LFLLINRDIKLRIAEFEIVSYQLAFTSSMNWLNSLLISKFLSSSKVFADIISNSVSFLPQVLILVNTSIADSILSLRNRIVEKS
jgi:hypothetical protein